MKKTSSAADWSARLRQKLEQERREIEAVSGNELRRLGENLRAHRERRAAYHRSRYGGSDPAPARDAAVGMAAAAGDRGTALDRHLRRELGVMQWLWWQIQSRIETKVSLELEIER